MTGPADRTLANLKMTDIRRWVGDRSLALLPAGAIEEHGPHLPLSTDALIAEAMVDALIEKYGDTLDLWKLPLVSYGRSVEHDWAPGTLTFQTDTFYKVLMDIGRSVSRAGFKRLVFVNGHGGNVSVIDAVLRDLRLAHGLLTFSLGVAPKPGSGLEFDDVGYGVHGGHVETSVMLHLCPDLVDMTTDLGARPPVCFGHNKHLKFGGGVSFGWVSEDFGPEGYIGDPRRSNADLGKRTFDAIAGALGEQLEEISRFDF